MGKVFQVFQQQNWVRAGEHFALRVGSLLFSMVSAHAILWFKSTCRMSSLAALACWATLSHAGWCTA